MTNPPSANPPSIQRQLAYVVLVGELVFLAHLGFDAIRHVPDSYAHEHLDELLGTMGMGFLALYLLSERRSTKIWLGVLACTLMTAQFVISWLF